VKTKVRQAKRHAGAAAVRRPLLRAVTWHGHGELPASFIAIFPLLLCYQLTLLFGSAVNGADVVSHGLFRLCGNSSSIYLLFHAGVAALFVWWIRRYHREQTLSLRVMVPLAIESAIYGLGLGAVLTLLVEREMGLSLGGQQVSVALGAGVHEEFMFRFVIGTAVLVATRKLRLSFPTALVVTCVVSSILFALAHHLGAHGEAFTVGAMAYRTFAGCVFAAIYWYRSLAHAVYAHVIYDLWALAGS
jgi:hypothetical protein